MKNIPAYVHFYDNTGTCVMVAEISPMTLSVLNQEEFQDMLLRLAPVETTDMYFNGPIDRREMH